MDRPTFSQSWSRVNRLTPTLRPHVQINRQLFRGEPWHVVQDPISNNFFRLPPVAYHLISLLDGKRTVDEVWRLTLDRYGDHAPTQNEVIGLLGQLNQSNLLRVDMPPDAQPLLERARRRRAKFWGGQAMSILFVRFPLYNPDRMLTWIAPVVRPFLSIWGLIAWFAWMIFWVSAFVPELGRFVTDVNSVLLPRNWAWMIVLFILTKALHEFGHGLVIKRFGGLVPEVGIMMLVLFPMPFVEASSSWGFGDRWKRLLAAGAGMMFELAAAGIAALIWLNANPGTLAQQLSYNVVFLASVSTILFNANPLLRFDGYYMLSDFLDIPNLYERATRQLKWFVQRFAYGITSIQPVTTAPGERVILTVYGIASQIYRVLVLAGIIMFVSGQLLTAGIALALWSFIAWVIVPLGKFVHWMATNPVLTEHRLRAVTATVVFIVAVFVGIGIVPADEHRRAEGIVQSIERTDVTMLTNGFVQRVEVEAGELVEKGQVILVAENLELRARRATLEAELRSLRAALLEGLRRNRSDMDMAEASAKSVTRELESVNERLDALIVRSPQAGTIVGGFLKQLEGRYLKRGQVIGRVLDLEPVLVTALVDQAQNATQFFDKIGRVELRTAGAIKTIIPSEVIQSFPGGRIDAPAALTTRGGGNIPMAPDDPDGRRTLRPQFEIWLKLPPATAGTGPLPGQRVFVRFTLASQKPLMYQWLHKIRQVVRDRLSI